MEKKYGLMEQIVVYGLLLRSRRKINILSCTKLLHPGVYSHILVSILMAVGWKVKSGKNSLQFILRSTIFSLSIPSIFMFDIAFLITFISIVTS